MRHRLIALAGAALMGSLASNAIAAPAPAAGSQGPAPDRLPTANGKASSCEDTSCAITVRPAGDRFSTTLATPRIPPVPPAEWTPAVRDMFAALSGDEARKNGMTASLPLFLANHPELGTRFLNFAVPLLRSSSLSNRLREIVTLRVAWRTQSEYEWGHHVAISQQDGVTPREIETIKAGDYSAFSDLERNALRAVDQLAMHSQVDDETWHALARQLNRHQQMELLFTIGSYTMMAWAANTGGVRIEPGEAGLDWSAGK